ncbi:MAG: 1-phosphofructokinase family hexose kinase [Agromyces sp.]|nr:1-phosphofructokinase family hexose kinase [Agromyces sp.]
MILTVTPNPAIDLTWRVERLTPGAVHRVPTGASRAGGKGVNVARVLHATGHDVVALTTAGGTTGDELRVDLEASGLRHRLVPTASPTRRSIAVVDRSSGDATILNELGTPLSSAESAALANAAADLGRSARAVAISGSLPPGFHPDELGALVGRLVAMGVPVVVDTSGPGILAAAHAGADALKPNREELADATGLADPIAGARSLIRSGARLVVVSLGEEGLLVVTAEAPTLHARLAVPLRGNPTGAGDAAVAAVTAATATGADVWSLTEAAAAERVRLARRAVAWSASAVLMPLAGELSARHVELETEVVVTQLEHATDEEHA